MRFSAFCGFLTVFFACFAGNASAQESSWVDSQKSVWLCERLSGSSVSSRDSRDSAFDDLVNLQDSRNFSMYWDRWPGDPWPKLAGPSLHILAGPLQNAFEVLKNTSGIDYQIIGDPSLGEIPEIRIPGVSDLRGSMDLLASVSNHPVLIRWDENSNQIQITGQGRLALSAGDPGSENYLSRKKFLQAFVRGQTRSFEVSENGDIFWFWGNLSMAQNLYQDLEKLLGKAGSVVSGNVSWRTELLFVSGEKITNLIPGEKFESFVAGPQGFLLSGEGLNHLLVGLLADKSRNAWLMSSGTVWWNPVRNTGINFGSVCGRKNFSGEFLPEKDLNFFLDNLGEISVSWGSSNLSVGFSGYSDLIFGKYLGPDFGGWVFVFLLQKDFGSLQELQENQEKKRENLREELL